MKVSHLAPTSIAPERVSPWQRCRPILAEVGRASLVYGLATAAYFGFIGILFQLGLFAGLRVLFFRGIAVMLVATPLFAVMVALAGARWRICDVRESIGAALVAASLTFTFFALGPVTVDRSISIFINGQMAAAPDRVFTAVEIDRLFRDRYLTDMDQIARRMEEQRITGTVEQVGNGYRITDKGKALIANSRWMATLFQTDKRLLDGGR